MIRHLFSDLEDNMIEWYNLIAPLTKMIMRNKTRYYCICCGKYSSGESPYKADGIGLCESCSSAIPFTSGGETFEGTKNVDYICSPMNYRCEIRDAFLKYKFGDNPAYSKVFSLILTRFFENYNYEDFDMLVPIPISKKRKMQRGYNQSELLIEPMCSELGIKIDKTSLTRIKDTQAQSNLRSAQRIENVRDAFNADSISVSNKKIILFDDIITTGNTIESCASALKKAGAEKVIGLSLFIVTSNRNDSRFDIPPLPSSTRTKYNRSSN